MKTSIDIKSAVIGAGVGIILVLGIILICRPPQPGSLNLTAVKRNLPETVTPMGPDATGPNEPHSYEFGMGEGKRVWRRIGNDTWHEVYPDGFASTFKVVGRTKVGDTEGTVVAKVGGDVSRTGTPNDGSLQAFIPDKGSDRMHHLFRFGLDGEWHDLAEMSNVQ